MRRLEVSAKAKTEILEIRFYTFDKWGQRQSDKYLSELQNTLQLLRESPLIGMHREDLSNKIHSFPYMSHIIYYQFNDETLYLMAILHKNRLPKNHLKDLDL